MFKRHVDNLVEFAGLDREFDESFKSHFSQAPAGELIQRNGSVDDYGDAPGGWMLAQVVEKFKPVSGDVQIEKDEVGTPLDHFVDSFIAGASKDDFVGAPMAYDAFDVFLVLGIVVEHENVGPRSPGWRIEG